MPRWLLLRLLPFWMLAVLAGSMISGPDKAVIGTYVPYSVAAAGKVSWKHRASHFIIFGITTLMLVVLGTTRKGRVLGLFGGIAFGCGIEIAQYLLFIPGIEWWDIRDDTIASIAAYTLLLNSKIRTLLFRTKGDSHRATTVVL